MNIQMIYSQLISKFPNLEIYQNHSLSPYTTVKIGGPADIFIHSKSSSELINILKYLAQATFEKNKPLNHFGESANMVKNITKSLKVTILGNGSNTLISDTGIRDIVIKNDSNEIKILDNNKIKVTSGVQISQLIKFTLNHNLTGLEEFVYIPATVGGAIFENIHGFDKNNFSQFLDSIEVFDLKTSQLNSSSDYSILQKKSNLIIISAIINLQSGNIKTAKLKSQDIYQKKTTSQPMNSLGCVFKNPPESICLPIWKEKKAASWIIDNQLHLKGHSIGDAQISLLHANFIVNNGQATASDYFKLINLVQSELKIKFNFQFELEIKLLGKF